MIKTVLNAAKNAKGWSNQKLAEATKLPLSTITNILGEGSKTENPRWDTVTTLARTLGVPLNALDEETVPGEPPKPNSASEAAAYYDAAKKYLMSQVEHEREEKEKERAERRKWQNTALGITAALVLILILVLVIIVIDIRNPEAGWFRMN